MAKFRVHAESWNTGEKRVYEYDNEFSTITLNGESIDLSAYDEYKGNFYKKVSQWDENRPAGKSNAPEKLKIQLGLKCNYSCQYCSQALHVESSVDFTPKQVEAFIQKLSVLDLSNVRRIEFWGGEPLVYWKTIKLLVVELEQLLKRDVTFIMITNGSLLSKEVNDFIVDHKMAIGISHDGPGQHLRGPDPFDDPNQMHWILDLYKRLNPKGLISINSIMNAKNTSRLDLLNYFREKLDDDVHLGEGSLLYVTNQGGVDLSLYDYQDMIKYRQQSFAELNSLPRSNMSIMNDTVTSFIRSIVNGRNYHTLGQRCGMDNPTHMALDMNGDVLSCQNVSATSVSFNGKSHCIGNIADVDNIKLNTGKHWSLQAGCSDCPVLQMCGGMCFLLKNEYWRVSCDNAYNDLIPFFLYVFEVLTGDIPYYIEPVNGELPEWRRDVLGMDKPDLTRKKKVIPIINI